MTGLHRSSRRRLALAIAPLGCVLVATLSLAGPAACQLGAGADALLATRYLWRGVERTNGWVLQPDVYVAYGLQGNGWITAGVWGNVELEHWSTTDLTDRANRKPGLGERDAWAQITRTLGGVDCTIGWIGYFRRMSLAGPPRRYDTHEVYASFQPRLAYLSPRVGAWWDVSEVRGFYFEGSIDVPVMGSFRGQRFWAAYLTATAGLNAGQGPDRDRPLAPVNFADKGITHLDLGAAFQFRGPLPDRWAATRLEGHLQLNRDPFTKRHSRAAGDDDHLVTVWAGVSLGVPAYHAPGE